MVAKAHLAESQELLAQAKRIQRISKKVEQKLTGNAGDSPTKKSETHSSRAAEWIIKEKPKVRLGEDVAGLDEVKQILERDVFLPMRHPGIPQNVSINLVQIVARGKNSLPKSWAILAI